MTAPLSRRRKLAFAALTLVLAFGVVEIGWRVSDWLKERKAFARTGPALSPEFRVAGGRRISERPSQVAQIHDPFVVVRHAAGELPGEMRIDENGFRGRPVAREKAPGVIRVALLGGSAAFGWGANDATTIPARLEARLTADPSGARYEVINAGVTGYNATQEMVLFVTAVSRFRPDIVIAYDGWNDLEIARTTPAARPLYPHAFWAFDAAADRAYDPLYRAFGWSAAYRGMRRKIERWEGGGLAAERAAATDLAKAFHPDLVAQYSHALEQLVRAARGNGAAAIICPQPELFSKSPHTAEEAAIAADQAERAVAARGYPLLVEAARRIAAAEGATFVDGRKAFEGLGETIFVDPVHVNDRGNDLVAALLAPAVKATAAAKRGN